LTDRELQLLELVVASERSHAIAAALGVSEANVKRQR
jgi:FixJ family two-component response regulator